MIILDEILFAVKEGLLTEEDVAALISSRPDNVHLVLTGRGCPESLIEKADIVTDMSDVKHSFADGTPAQPGELTPAADPDRPCQLPPPPGMPQSG